MSARRTLLFPALALLAAFASAQELTADQKTEIERVISERVTKVAFVPGADFSTWPKVLEKHRPALNQAKTAGDFANVINNALGEYKCSHFSVITPEQVEAQRSGTKTGIGIYPELKPEGIAINGVLPGSPAEKAGLKGGDLIVLVNGEKPTSLSALGGNLGDEFKLTIQEPSGKRREVKVTRSVFTAIEPQSLRWTSPDTVVLRIPTFEQHYKSKVAQDHVTQAAKAKNLIIDLRGNPGGYVFNMLNFAGLLLPSDKPMGTMVNRYRAEQFVKETSKRPDDLIGFAAWNPDKMRPAKSELKPFSGKIAVLIDGGTGSAAEILSAALRDISGAKVFGQRSIGMVLAAVMMELPHNFKIMVPIQDYITVNGTRLEGTGVIPDFLVKGQKAGDQDPVLNEALKWVGN